MVSVVVKSLEYITGTGSKLHLQKPPDIWPDPAHP